MSVDLVTSLQFELSGAHRMLADFIKHIRSHAPPEAVQPGEDVTPAPPDTETREAMQQHASDFGDRLVKSFKRMQELIDQLPEASSRADEEEEQLGRIEALQAQNEEVRRQLKREYECAQAKLSHAQGLFAALAQNALDQRCGAQG